MEIVWLHMTFNRAACETANIKRDLAEDQQHSKTRGPRSTSSECRIVCPSGESLHEITKAMKDDVVSTSSQHEAWRHRSLPGTDLIEHVF